MSRGFASSSVRRSVRWDLLRMSAQTPQITQNPDVPPTWIPDIKFASGREIVPYSKAGSRILMEALISSSHSIAIRSRSFVCQVPELCHAGRTRPRAADFLAKRQPRMLPHAFPRTGRQSADMDVDGQRPHRESRREVVACLREGRNLIATNNSTGETFGEVTNRPRSRPPRRSQGPSMPRR